MTDDERAKLQTEFQQAQEIKDLRADLKSLQDELATIKKHLTRGLLGFLALTWAAVLAVLWPPIAAIFFRKDGGD